MGKQLVAVVALLCGAGMVLAEQQTRPPAEWLAIVRRETAEQEQAESEAWRRLLASAARALHPHGPGPDKLAEREAARRKQFEPFLTWLEREGNALFAKWRRGEKLPAEERRHLPMLQGVCLFRYRVVRRKKGELTPEEQRVVAYGNAVVKRGEALLRHGYLGGSFTRPELHELWVYALWLDIRNTGGGVLPFHLGLASGYQGRRPPIGQPARDFTLLRMEAALASPDYSNRNPKHPAGLLRPASPLLQELLLAMQGYESVPNARPPRVRARPVAVPEGREADTVRLSDFKGRKAVLLVLANATDAWAWHWKICPMLEPLHQAYRDRIAFFFIHTTIHDAHMPVKDFFGPDPGRHDAVHETALWQRARVCKMFYMDRPQCTVPYLLDDMAQRTRNAYRDQGGGAYIVLIDLDGRVAYADYHQDIPPHWGPKAISFHDEYVYVRMNHLESRLKSFVANGCRYAKAIETPYPTWRKSPEAKGTVAVVDAAAKRLTVAVEEQGEKQERGLTVAPTTRVTIDLAPAKVADLEAGDRVTVSWIPGKSGGKSGVTARRIEAVRDPAAARGRDATIWLSGRIVSVDPESRVLTVERHQPDVAAMRGWDFWQAAGDKATPFDAGSKARLGIVRKWIEGDADARTVRFVIDDAVDLFLDGHGAVLGELNPGDCVGVLYRTWQDGRPRIYPEQVRAYRVPVC